jgi:hypothetical protein
VAFNRELGRVLAELKEVSKDLGIKGVGIDEEGALRDLERQFDQLVTEKVRIPPHARRPDDDRIRSVVNHLVNWDQFERDNPAPQLLWGRITGNTHSSRPRVHWRLGLGGMHGKIGEVPPRLESPYFRQLDDGDWFQAVVLDYLDHIEWIEPPVRRPDPTDPEARAAAWQAIARTLADEPDVWPLKES